MPIKAPAESTTDVPPVQLQVYQEQTKQNQTIPKMSAIDSGATTKQTHLTQSNPTVQNRAVELRNDINLPKRIMGAGLSWCFYDNVQNVTQTKILAAWQSQIPWFKQAGFNTLRLAIAPPDSLASKNYGFNSTALTEVISLLGDNGFKVVLDNHNWYGNMQGCLYGSQGWHDFWMNMSAVYGKNANVYAYELMNEPIPGGLDVTPQMTTPQSIQDKYAWLISDIRATGDTKPILLPDPAYWQSPDFGDPVGWQSGKQTLPCLTGIVESTHNYYLIGEGLSYGETVKYYENKLLAWNNVTLSISGEWGFYDYSSSKQMDWAKDWMHFLDSNNLGYFYWMSGYPEFDEAKNNMNKLLGITAETPST